MQIISSNLSKLTDHFDDEIFKHEWLSSFKENVVITIALLDFEQKDFLFKLSIEEKIQRFLFLKQMAAKFYKAGNMKQA